MAALTAGLDPNVVISPADRVHQDQAGDSQLGEDRQCRGCETGPATPEGAVPRIMLPSVKVTVRAGVDPLEPIIFTEAVRVMGWPKLEGLGLAVKKVSVSKTTGGGVGVGVGVGVYEALARHLRMSQMWSPW